jgi:hypothetical protein
LGKQTYREGCSLNNPHQVEISEQDEEEQEEEEVNKKLLSREHPAVADSL